MSKTVFIVGAGASNEVDLPVGTGLKDEITGLLNIKFENGFDQSSGDQTIWDAIRVHMSGSNQRSSQAAANGFFNAARRIRDGLPLALSIDNFIDAHNHDGDVELCGKLAIVRAILKAEQNSKLYISSRSSREQIDFAEIEQTWFAKFFQSLTQNCRVENLPGRLSKVAMVVFNYDRCIEHYLFHAFQTYYGIRPEEAASLVTELAIYHPYGTVGRLPWQGVPPGSAVIQYGADPGARQLLNLAGQIKTFTEGTDPDSSEIVAIRKVMRDSERLVFIGFAFHPLNMKLLWEAETQTNGIKKCFATAKGISDSDLPIIKSHLANYGGIPSHEVQVRNSLTCSGLFHEFWRSLAL